LGGTVGGDISNYRIRDIEISFEYKEKKIKSKLEDKKDCNNSKMHYSKYW